MRNAECFSSFQFLIHHSTFHKMIPRSLTNFCLIIVNIFW